MSFKNVGYALTTAYAQTLFAKIQVDSTLLDSLKTAVLGSANSFGATVGVAPTDGAKWTQPRTGDKFNVAYKVLNADSVTVIDIQPR